MKSSFYKAIADNVSTFDEDSLSVYEKGSAADDCENVAKGFIKLILDGMATIPQVEEGKVSTLAIDSYITSVKHNLGIE